MPASPYHREDLARIHHEGFASHADAVAPGILELLEPLLERDGLVLEIGCGSGLLTRYLVAAGHRVLAFDICDLEWGAARREQPPGVWFGDDWVLTTRFSVPEPWTFRREMTTFVRAGDLWRRDDETHDNVLVDTRRIPALLARHGVDAQIKPSFGDGRRSPAPMPCPERVRGRCRRGR